MAATYEGLSAQPPRPSQTVGVAHGHSGQAGLTVPDPAVAVADTLAGRHNLQVGDLAPDRHGLAQPEGPTGVGHIGSGGHAVYANTDAHQRSVGVRPGKGGGRVG